MEMCGKPFRFTKKQILHLLPCVFPVFFWIDFHMLSLDEEQLFVQTFLDPEKLTWKMEVISVTPALFALPYIVIATLKVHKYANAAKNVFTNIETLKTGYIKEFVNLTLIEILILLLLNFFIPAKHIEIIWVPILGNILYFYIVYKSYNYSVIFSEEDYRKYRELFLPLEEFTQEASQKYSQSVLTNIRADEYARTLGEGFELHKWHLDPELNLKMLSEKTGIPVHYISQTINQRFEKNFFDYVNCYRVEDLKLKLLNPALAHIKIEELSYMSGFNSKAAFQRAFKKHAGMSPTDYRSLQTPDTLQTTN